MNQCSLLVLQDQTLENINIVTHCGNDDAFDANLSVGTLLLFRYNYMKCSIIKIIRKIYV